MKTAALALLLFASTSAVCQSAAPAQPDPFRLWQMPPAQAKPSMDFTEPQSTKRFEAFTPLRLFTGPKRGEIRRWGDAGIDPKILLHPPQAKLGLQAPGTTIAKNEFPNLELLPIASRGSALKPIPREWPSFELEAIPSKWPKFQLNPVDGANQPLSPAK